MDPSNCRSLCLLSRGGLYFPRVSSQSREMLQPQPLEGKKGTESEEREDSSMADLKEIVTLALVGENIANPKGLQNAQQQGKKKRKKKRLGLKDGGWGSTLVRAGGAWEEGGLGVSCAGRGETV